VFERITASDEGRDAPARPRRLNREMLAKAVRLAQLSRQGSLAMPGTKPRHAPILVALVVLLACAIPGLALSAPPGAPAPERVMKPAASKAKARSGQARDSKRTQRPADAPAKQPYRALVDTVRKSTDAFGDDNVSESGERDRLQDPPPR
jgi:hypothetical protein